MKDRGRQLDHILNQYMTFVKPAFEEFCLPVSYHLFHWLVSISGQIRFSLIGT